MHKRRANKPAPAAVIPPDASPTHRPVDDARPSQEEIRLHAYLAWEAAGKPNGDAAKFWLEAEQQLAAP